MRITTLPYTQVDCLHQASPDGSQGARTPEKATVKSQQALIDVIVEAMPQQAAQLQASLSTLVTVAWLEVKPAFDETLRQYVVCVRDDMLNITRREIQRLATDCRVFLRRCEPIKLDPPPAPLNLPS